MYLSANKHFTKMTLDINITDSAGFNDNFNDITRLGS